jgi:hypothetical protein
MTTIKVSALDTAQAMDEIAAKLGADAMIIDTSSAMERSK